MGWCRTNMRLGACCALFALACQIALSFTHVHASGFGPRALAASLAARLAAQLPAADQSSHRLASVPVPGSPKGGDFCPICTLIGLAGSLLPLSPPTLSLPVAVASSVLSIAADRERALSAPNRFQARAPPIA
jgi:hypothetical protein